MNFVRTIALVAAALAMPTMAVAQDYPKSTVTIVVPSSPGAGQDTMGRFLADALSKLWNQNVVVENVPGAGGTIGTANIAQSKPDGYRILVTANTYNTNAAVLTLPFDPLKDLVPVAMVARGNLVVVTGQRVPMPTLADVVKEAKAQTLYYGSSGVGALPSFAAELLASKLGIKLQRIVYKGAAEAMIDLAGKRIDLYIATLTTVMPSIESKAATPVLVMSESRAKALPDVPTVVEAGYPDAKAEVWYGVLAPAGTPDDVIKKLNEGIVAVTNSPEGKAFLDKTGSEPAQMNVEEFTKLLTEEMAMWKKVAVENNLTEK